MFPCLLFLPSSGIANCRQEKCIVVLPDREGEQFYFCCCYGDLCNREGNVVFPPLPSPSSTVFSYGASSMRSLFSSANNSETTSNHSLSTQPAKMSGEYSSLASMGGM